MQIFGMIISLIFICAVFVFCAAPRLLGVGGFDTEAINANITESYPNAILVHTLRENFEYLVITEDGNVLLVKSTNLWNAELNEPKLIGQLELAK